MPTTTLPYRYTHASTESMTGYFSCEPPEDLCFEEVDLPRLPFTTIIYPLPISP